MGNDPLAPSSRATHRRWLGLALIGLALGGLAPAQGAAGAGSPQPLLLLRPNAGSVQLGATVSATVKVIGHSDPSRYVQLLYAKAPFRHYRLAMQGTPSTRGAVTLTLAYPGNVLIDRNLRLRARSGSSVSNTVEVYVYPSLSLNGFREQGGASPWLDFSAAATVHRATRYPHPRVYFYRRYSRHAPYVLFHSQPLRVAQRNASDTVLVASFRARDPRAPSTAICLRRPILADMGHPFFDASCGRPRLP